MKTHLLFGLAAVAAFNVSTAPLGYAQSAEFTGLGVYNTATSISGDGSVVVGYDKTEAFRWTKTDGIMRLGFLPGGYRSRAYDVNFDGSVIVGESLQGSGWSTYSEAFRWTQADGMVGLGFLPGASSSSAYGVNADGSVVVGWSGDEAFRWTQANGMVGLGFLPGDNYSYASDVNADGTVIVGGGVSEAFRWTQADGMVGLGFLSGGNWSSADAVSADGSVVVGGSELASGNTEAFRWTQADGMVGLGYLSGGNNSWATDVNADGSVVVGSSNSSTSEREAFRWTQANGMQSVTEWLADNGITVSGWELTEATGVSDDGTVVVGRGLNPQGESEGWLARGSSGLISLDDFSNSLATVAISIPAVLNPLELFFHGLHGRPAWRRRGGSQYCTWASGDLGRDTHGQSNGRIGLGEIGLCWRPNDDLYFGFSAAYTGFNQKLPYGGRAKSNGLLVSLENQIRMTSFLSAPLWLVATGAIGWSDLDIRRGYLNAGNPDSSEGDTSYTSMGGRFRLEWENAFPLSKAGGFTPHFDLSILHARIKGYTETGGGFPARFDAMSRTVADLRVGLDYEHRLTEKVTLYAGADYVHRIGKMDYEVSGEVLGLFDFSGLGYAQYEKRDWAQFRLGMEAHVGPGMLNFAANATTKGATPSWWLNVGYRVDL